MPLLWVSEKKKTILVTGGAGFIGSYLCKALLDRGSTVIAVDNLITGSVDNILALEKHPRFSFLRQDITKPNFAGSLGSRHFDEVFNLACPTGVPNIGVLSQEMLLTSSIGSKNVFDVARASRARVVHASTGEVYGQAQVFPQHEEYEGAVNPVGPRSPYEEGKRFAESLAVMYARRYDLDISIVRIFNTYGKGMAAHDQRVIPKFRQAVRRREPLPIHGNGSQRRTFLYIDDLISGILLVAKHGEKGEVYNCGSTKETSVLELADLVISITGHRHGIMFRPHITEDHAARLPAVQKISGLGWRPRVALPEGLHEVFAADRSGEADRKTELQHAPALLFSRGPKRP